MTKRIITIFILFIGLTSFSQSDKNQFIGLNLIQLPASTININYSIDCKPFLTPIADIGYAFGYNYKYDLIGHFLTPHNDTYDGYTIEKQSGGYVKVGGFLNLRKNFEKLNFFHLGLFITNSMVYEKGLYLSIDDSRPYAYADEVEHTIYIFGFSSSIGYEFMITNHLKANTDFQLSFPNRKYLDLYSYTNFIPGMGYKDCMDKWFPMVILNLKYRL
ncbi:MAG: hypothetical protein RBR28_10365 [Lentimicrobium sp.]|jgi:hypothetical protein|nr:hypothetical protein [Lentimicrobium sp.]